jgi:hypothetical protein
MSLRPRFVGPWAAKKMAPEPAARLAGAAVPLMQHHPHGRPGRVLGAAQQLDAHGYAVVDLQHDRFHITNLSQRPTPSRPGRRRQVQRGSPPGK